MVDQTMPVHARLRKCCTPCRSALLTFESTLLRWESAIEGIEVVETVKVVARDARSGPGAPGGGGISETDAEGPGGAWAADGTSGRCSGEEATGTSV